VLAEFQKRGFAQARRIGRLSAGAARLNIS
jgi:hypothetical protein